MYIGDPLARRAMYTPDRPALVDATLATYQLIHLHAAERPRESGAGWLATRGIERGRPACATRLRLRTSSASTILRPRQAGDPGSNFELADCIADVKALLAQVQPT